MLRGAIPAGALGSRRFLKKTREAITEDTEHRSGSKRLAGPRVEAASAVTRLIDLRRRLVELSRGSVFGRDPVLGSERHLVGGSERARDRRRRAHRPRRPGNDGARWKRAAGESARIGLLPVEALAEASREARREASRSHDLNPSSSTASIDGAAGHSSPESPEPRGLASTDASRDSRLWPRRPGDRAPPGGRVRRLPYPDDRSSRNSLDG